LTNRRLLGFAPLLAALVFGSWAAFVNSEYGLYVAMRSGIGQGTYALFSTWIVSRTAGAVFSFTGNGAQSVLLSFVASFLVMVSIPLTIHHALGTPEVLDAILPGILWGSGYIATYIWFLFQTSR